MTSPGFKALLVAAGVGSRLRPLTDVLPKCLMPINGRPLLGIWLDMLAEGGATEIVVNLHHHADLVAEYLRRSPHSGRVTPVIEEELLGTAGTLLRNRERLLGDSLFFAHADNLSSFALDRFLATHRNRPPGTAMTMMTFIAEDPRKAGVVDLDAKGVVVGFHEKSPNPPGNLANAAVFMLEPEVLAFLAALGKPVAEFSTDVIPHYVGRIATFRNDLYHRDIGSIPSFLQAQIEYPLVETEKHIGGGDDPWFGMMREADGRLGRLLTQAVSDSLRPLTA